MKRYYVPGGDKAKAQGCSCPSYDNEYGSGLKFQPSLWVVHLECPIHGSALRQASEMPAQDATEEQRRRLAAIVERLVKDALHADKIGMAEVAEGFAKDAAAVRLAMERAG